MPLLDLHGTLDLGNWAPNRDALTACGVPFEVLDAGQIEHRFGIRADPGDRGLYQADGGIIVADAAVEALGAGLEVREGCRVEAVEEDDDGVSAGGVRARVAVVTAGAWAPALAGVDAIADRRDGLVLQPRPPGAVGDRYDGRREVRLRARGHADRRAQGGPAPDRPPHRPRRGQRPRSRAGRADGGLGRAAASRRPAG